ncbi:MAG: hypothetical protein A4E55_02452 [Pelotomaculum sp. PtaU1.Bin035]|nr:MAG: hypothetical protein A4E55_02452 [Pelotomaculum sp. PtaU1.Bin035]
MLGVGYSLLMAVKVIILFTFIYIFIPAQISNFKNEDKLLDKVFIGLIYSNIITISIVHCLAFLKLYEFLSLLLCYLIVYIIYSWQKGRNPDLIADALGMKLVLNLLDISEGRSGLRGELFDQLKNWLNQFWKSAVQILRYSILNPIAGLFTVIILVAAAVIRFNHSIIHAYYGAADPYVHLIWIKYLGLNQIYRDGIYPYGYHAVLSAFSKLFFLDPYFVVRFVGPLAGFFLLLSVYYFALRNFKSPHAALIAIFIYGIIVDDRFPSHILRQSNALSQEYATIFLLPGIHFFNLYMKNASKRYLKLSAACLALTLLIHPYVTVFLLLGYSIIFLCYPKNILNTKFFFRSVFVMLLSSLAGILPIIIGVITGKKFHDSSINYIERNVQIIQDKTNFATNSIKIFSENNPYLLAILICFTIILLYELLLVVRKINRRVDRAYLFCALISLISYLQYRAAELGLPVIMNPYRTEVFLTLFAALTYAGTLDIINSMTKIKTNTPYDIKLAVTLATMITMLIFIPLKIPEGNCYEYDEAVQAYLEIKSIYPIFNWTIVAPVEQYQQTLGQGWHYDLIEFVKKIPTADKEGDKSFSIPTDYIFIFTEKIPLGSNKTIEMVDRKTKIPETKGPETEFYYRDVVNRTIIEARAYYWAEEYMKKNNNMKVFFDGQYMKIFLIKQDLRNPVLLFS